MISVTSALQDSFRLKERPRALRSPPLSLFLPLFLLGDAIGGPWSASSSIHVVLRISCVDFLVGAFCLCFFASTLDLELPAASPLQLSAPSRSSAMSGPIVKLPGRESTGGRIGGILSLPSLPSSPSLSLSLSAASNFVSLTISTTPSALPTLSA